MHVSQGKSFEPWKAFIHGKLLSTGNMEYEFSISNDDRQLANVKKAANAVGCDFEAEEPSGGKIVIRISRRSDQFF